MRSQRLQPFARKNRAAGESNLKILRGCKHDFLPERERIGRVFVSVEASKEVVVTYGSEQLRKQWNIQRESAIESDSVKGRGVVAEH